MASTKIVETDGDGQPAAVAQEDDAQQSPLLMKKLGEQGNSLKKLPQVAALAAKPAPASDGKRSSDANIKWFVLAFLVFQNSAASMLMRYSRASGVEWSSQMGVIMQEVIKAAACTVLLALDGTLRKAFADRREALRTAVPAMLYLLQNNMQLVAVSHLEAPAYAVLYQLKILSTALLSVVMLKRTLSGMQWAALLLLTAGVATVVLSQISSPAQVSGRSETDVMKGLVAVLLACVTSGLAGVYFEKLLKGSTVSLWTRNLQLALYSIVTGVGTLALSEPDLAREDLFRGFTPASWLCIVNNALGGLLIAVVIKYADNILKNFSTALSILLTTVLSSIVFDSPVNALFAAGTGLVIYAVFLYGNMSLLDMFFNRCCKVNLS